MILVETCYWIIIGRGIEGIDGGLKYKEYLVIKLILRPIARIISNVMLYVFERLCITNNMVVITWLPSKIMMTHFFACVVTDDLKPRMIDARFFDCGPNWLAGYFIVGVVETQCIASLPVQSNCIASLRFVLYSLSPIITIPCK